MTKIKILADRVIFDGHAETREECETITLLCDGLANNPNFKTIRYESGYAEFEKTGKAEKLMFAIGDITVNFDSNITKVECIAKNWEWTTSGTSLEVSGVQDGTSYLFNVTLATGYVLNTVSANFNSDGSAIVAQTDSSFTITAGSGATWTITITSKAAAPTISFRHLYSGGTIGSGAVKFKAYSQAKPATGETWVLNSTLSGTLAEQNTNFTSNNTSFVSIVASGNNPMSYALKYKTSDGSYNEVFQPQLGWVAGEAYRTITFETAPTGDLLTWLQSNGTKQGGVTEHTLTFSGVRVTVNGSSVTSPHLLQNGDTIVASVDGVPAKGDEQPWSIIYVNGETYTSDGYTTEDPIDINNEDIVISSVTETTSFDLTINYTA